MIVFSYCRTEPLFTSSNDPEVLRLLTRIVFSVFNNYPFRWPNFLGIIEVRACQGTIQSQEQTARALEASRKSHGSEDLARQLHQQQEAWG